MTKTMGLGSAFFKGNRKRLQAACGDAAPIVITANSLLQRSVDSAYAFTQDSNFWYLTGLSEPGVVLVMDKSEEYLILPPQSAVRDAFEGEMDAKSIRHISGIESVHDHADGWSDLAKRLKKAKRVATLQPPQSYIEPMDMFTNPSRARLLARMQEENDALEVIDLRNHLATLRSVKSEAEIRAIKNAIRETANIFEIIDRKWQTAERENDLMAEIQAYLTRQQLEFAYDPIIASGKNALTLHYSKNNGALSKDSFLLLDIGVKTQGYNADITRTIIGKPNERQEAVYNAVLEVHELACSLLKPGADIHAYEQAVHDFMGSKLKELGLIRKISPESVREFYPHSTSHFLGIDVHDTGDYKQPLSPGMVLTVEPGIYIKEENIGIRLEDNILITENGNENLSSQLPKNISSLTIKANA
jgi:Xaa-Pro aminopeptidase